MAGWCGALATRQAWRCESSRWTRRDRQEEATTLRGLATISYYADDVEEAKSWYSEILGIVPYFVRPTEGSATILGVMYNPHYLALLAGKRDA